MKEIKLKIFIYSTSLLTLIGLVIYGFIYLKIELSTAIVLPFMFAGLFLIFKSSSEIVRYSILNNQMDNLPIKEAGIYFGERLAKIIKIDFIIYLALFYSMGIFFLLGLFLNIGGIKAWAISTNLSSLLFIFSFLLFITPWLIRKILNQRYKDVNLNLKNSIDYYIDEAS
ncbi:MAG: hypothetical protein K9H26_08880 [Prolixibacteraceae bacterium]|nr:hypothetical protein [Prolixibacteraceae bacterium]